MSAIRNFTSAALAAIIGSAVAAGPAAADEIADFYKDKQVKIIVGSGAGGGYDTYARLVERHLGRHIPGNPSIITQNMTGAGGVRAANYVENVAPKDGSIIAGMQRGVALVQMMGQKGPKFKAADLNWLGSLAKEAGVCALATRTGVKSLSDTFRGDKQYTTGGTGPNSTEFWPALLRNTMAANFKLIRGYPATPQIHLAIDRGELDGVCQSWASFKVQSKEALEAGTIKPLVQISLHPDKEMTALGVPMLEEFLRPDNMAQGVSLEDAKLFFRLTVIPPVMGRPFAMASGVPDDKVKVMRKAFAAMVKDPQFLADAKKLKRDVEFVDGEEIQEILKDLSKTPTSKMAALNEAFKFRGPVEQVVLPIVRDTGKVVATKRKGRKISIDVGGKKSSASVSGSRTKVMIDGKKAKRGAVKVGMTCTFVYYGNNTQAKELDCKS
jgi:tripartite-type tricarboxylate transporter receptor subunit TctC